MAKTTTVDLGNASVVADSKWKNGSSVSVSGAFDGTVNNGETIDSAKPIVVDKVGTFTATDTEKTATFVANSAFSGELSVKPGAEASLSSLDFSAATGGIQYTVADKQTVQLGKGADTVSMAAAGSSVTGYNYSDGDVISVGGFDKASVDTTGNIAVDGKLNVGTNAGDVYKARFAKSDATRAYWTTAANSRATAIDASNEKNLNEIIIDATHATDAAISLGETTATVSVAGANAINAGKGNATLYAAADTDNWTLSLGRTDGQVSLGTNAGPTADRTIVFEGGQFKQLSTNSTSNAAGDQFIYGKASVAGIGTAGSVKAKFGTDTGVMAYGSTMTASSDTKYYFGLDQKSSLSTGNVETLAINLGDSNTYHDVHYLTVASENAKGSIQLSNKGDKVDSHTKKSLEITLGTDSDVVSLQAGASDTIKTSAVTGLDSITGFQTGFGTDADVLEITDLSSMSDIEAVSNKTLYFDEKHAYGINFTDATDDQLLIKFAGATEATKVATTLTNQNVVTAAADADFVIGSTDVDTTYKVTGGKDTDVAFFALDDTKKYTNIANLDVTDYAGQAIVVGTTDSNTITLGKAAAAVWGGGSESDAFGLADDHAASHIWFSQTDGEDTVKKFNAKSDDVLFWKSATLADIASNYSFARTNNNIVITSKSDKHDKLTLTGLNDTQITVRTQDLEKATTTKVTFADDANGFDTDSLIYVGVSNDKELAASDNLQDAKKTYGVDLRGDKGIFDSKIYNVNSFTAENSNSQYLLIGSGESTLRGGATANAFWGGDSDSQTFIGTADATDYFWIGNGDGHDTATSVGFEDVVYLWSTNSVDDVKITVNGNDVDVVYANENDLTLSDGYAAVKAGLTFETQDGTQYTYDLKSQSLKAKSTTAKA